MLPKHSIEIVIQPDGSFEAAVLGVEGSACSEISKFLDELGDVTEDRKTTDYYKKPSQATIKVGGGGYGR
jgi:hypothetical protein